MANWSCNRNVKTLNLTIFIYLLCFLEIEQVENWLITTIAIIGKYYQVNTDIASAYKWHMPNPIIVYNTISIFSIRKHWL